MAKLINKISLVVEAGGNTWWREACNN